MINICKKCKNELMDFKLENKYLVKNIHMNAPKFNRVTDYSKDQQVENFH